MRVAVGIAQLVGQRIDQQVAPLGIEVMCQLAEQLHLRAPLIGHGRPIVAFGADGLRRQMQSEPDVTQGMCCGICRQCHMHARQHGIV